MHSAPTNSRFLKSCSETAIDPSWRMAYSPARSSDERNASQTEKSSNASAVPGSFRMSVALDRWIESSHVKEPALERLTAALRATRRARWHGCRLPLDTTRGLLVMRSTNRHMEVAVVTVQSLPEKKRVLRPPGTRVFREPFFCADGFLAGTRANTTPSSARHLLLR